MEYSSQTIELWADSFHEGDWACSHLASIHQKLGLTYTKKYKNGFIPIYNFEFKEKHLEIIVYGSYTSWSPLPKKINDLIKWGKPDFLAYDKKKNEILFAVEETAAIPTGNQALQRCERQYGASRQKIPFWYLLAEYGMHKDGGIRRDSIWPTIMGIKLSQYNNSPSIVVHYADKENPEGYDFGNGVDSLFTAIYQLINNFITGKNNLHGMHSIFREQYGDMFRFLKSQSKNIMKYLPGEKDLDNQELINDLADLAIGEKKIDYKAFKDKYPKFLHWPKLQEWFKDGGDKVPSSLLIKNDELAKKLEESIDNLFCYVISSNAGSKPQKKDKVSTWLNTQKESFEKSAIQNKLNAKFSLNINEFPISQNGNLHITTAKNIIYFFDNFFKLKEIINSVMPRTVGLLDDYEDKESLLYISNSIRPGRIFGDPFTGQISAYASSFGKLEKISSRLMIAYFPHQSFSQFIDTPSKLVNNKGFVLMRELLDFVVLHGGVIVKFNENGRAEAF